MKAQKYKGNGFPSGKWQAHSLDLDTWFQDQLEIRRRKGVKSWVTLSGLILINPFHIYYTFCYVFLWNFCLWKCVCLSIYMCFLNFFFDFHSVCLCCSILVYLFYLSSSSSSLLLYAYLYSNKRQKNGVGLSGWRHRNMLGLLRDGKP